MACALGSGEHTDSTRSGRNVKMKKHGNDREEERGWQGRMPDAAGSSQDTDRAQKRGVSEVEERTNSPDGDGSGQQRTALDTATPISRSREKRTIKPIERLGVVPGERPVKERKRRKTGSGIIYIERAGAHSGELKYMIKAAEKS